MRDSGFRMLGRLVGMTGLAVSDGLVQVFDALVQMRILHACGLCMFQRLFRMLRHGISVALLAMIHCALGMLNGFSHMFVVGLGHHRQTQQCDHGECRRSTSDAHCHGFLLMGSSSSFECMSYERRRNRN